MTATNYIWDFATDSYLMEKEDGGTTTAVSTCEPVQYGRLISQRRNGQTYFHHFDAQGSTRTVTDQSQNIVEEATYSAFGETVAKTSSITNPFGFKGALGYYANPETDDFYVRARTLAPLLGRWHTVDPVGYKGSRRQLYEYAANSPLTHSDPSGLTVSGDPLGVLVICGVAFGFRLFCPKLVHVCFCDYFITRDKYHGIQWQHGLFSCPCNIGSPPTNPSPPNDPGRWQDPEARPWHRPGASSCIRSRFIGNFHRQECCYDDSGRLITEGSGAGRPHYDAHFSTVNDLLYFESCCRTGNLSKYYRNRPPNNGNNCPTNKKDEPVSCAEHADNPYLGNLPIYW